MNYHGVTMKKFQEIVGCRKKKTKIKQSREEKFMRRYNLLRKNWKNLEGNIKDQMEGGLIKNRLNILKIY